MPASPIKVTLRAFLGEDFFCRCHCLMPLSTICSLVTHAEGAAFVHPFSKAFDDISNANNIGSREKKHEIGMFHIINVKQLTSDELFGV